MSGSSNSNLLSGKEAAYIANAAYALQVAPTSAQALSAGQVAMGSNDGSEAMGGFTPQRAFVGTSGAFIREQTGFGLVLQRGREANREIVVAIRGTASIADGLTDANAGFDRGPDGSLVHAGFNRTYRSFAGELRDAVRRSKAQRIHFVGHSLGGALASVAASEFAGQHRIASCLYTFGAPRVGSLGFCNTLRSNLPAGRVKRIYAISDPVPMLPFMPFCHYTPGSTGIVKGFSTITMNAHSMINCYMHAMPDAGWPSERLIPTKSDPDYWLDMAENSPGIMSSMGYFCLGMALGGLMGMLNGLGIAVGVGITLVDRLIAAQQMAGRIGREMGARMLRFVKAALKLAGRAAVASTLAAADITASFLRFVFDVLSRPVIMAADAALAMVR